MLITVLIFVLLASCDAVDRANFKTCQQSSFCRRHRAVSPNESPYIALLDTLTQSPQSGVSVDVHNDHNGVLFTLHLLPLKDSMLRVLMDEKAPLYPRFKEPFAVLEANLKTEQFVVSTSSTSLSLKFGSLRAEVQAQPLLLNLYRADALIITLNAQGLLKYEHYRKRSKQQNVLEPLQEEGFAAEEEQPVPEQVLEEQQQQPQVQEDDVPVDDEPDQDGLWEETFKGHTDSKPRGPSSVGVDIAFLDSKHVYGIPEHADSFSLKDTASGDPYRLYNLDVFEYELDNPMALYASIPMLISHSVQRGSAGVFWHNAAETWVDIKHLPDTDVVSSITGFFGGRSGTAHAQQQVSTRWISESGIIDVFLMAGPAPMDVFRQYATVTGTTNLPPLFSLAYHQCRWNYNDQDDVRDVHDNFDKYDIPLDVMWLDIEHTDGKRYFTWDEHKFPDPIGMTEALSARGRKLVTIVDPHIKRDSNYFFYQENRDLDHYVKTKDGQEFDGWCWPGSSSYLDMTNPKARQHYMETYKLDRYKGSTLDTFTWNDMNEPSVFNGPEVTMQKDCVHPGLGVEHRELHNINGMLFHASTYEGHLLRSDYKLRPFILTRAAFAGSQRSAAIWTGDNTAEWGHLRISVPMLLSLSVAGMTHTGSDIGGFFGNPDAALLARWYQAAAYTPFMRAHAHLDTKRREPWLFDRHTLAVIRRAVRDRYRLLPLWYTLFWENERTGAPPMRPMWVEYPSDEHCLALEKQYMVGSSLLVAPVVEAGATSVSVYFPVGLWYDTHDNSVWQGPATHQVSAPPEKIPVYQRGGSILSRKERVRRSSPLMRDDPYTLVVALAEDGFARGTLYVDDEHTMEYRKGHYLYLEFTFNGNQLTSRIIEPQGTASLYTTKSWLERVVILGLNNQPSRITMVTKSGGQVSLEGSFSRANDRTSSRLIVRKPDINIAEPFTISLH